LIQENFNKQSGFVKSLIQMGVKSKLHYLHTDGSTEHKIWDTAFFHKTKALFGGRCKKMVTGSAPVSPDILDFMKVVLCCPIMEGYG